ncbi:helix-turn-helix domain-containing protein [Caulobacter sp. NIBR2454]|uniref:helix-turn-helix domain-containing protein n=1 Tax=Caulobacter sp. NIBR2454 TaxID=3015996 RepID=UPI0022B6ABDE|nr:helix-turn-helix transcriptional regulator [Caulobacter sp. NIBR2454]
MNTTQAVTARISQKQDGEGRLEKLGKVIARARQEGDGPTLITQERLANATGIDRAHMSRLERGKSNVTILNVLRVADALGMPASELLRRAGL